jgi:hypothetical protein
VQAIAIRSHQIGRIELIINCNYKFFVKNRPGQKARAMISGSSSVGRATAFQAVGRGFEPRLPLSVAGALLPTPKALAIEE